MSFALLAALLATLPLSLHAGPNRCPALYAHAVQGVSDAPFVTGEEIGSFFRLPSGAIAYYTSKTGFKELYKGLQQVRGSGDRLRNLKILEDVELELLRKKPVEGRFFSGGIIQRTTIDQRFRPGKPADAGYLVSATPDEGTAKKFAEFHRPMIGWLKRAVFGRERVIFSIHGRTGRPVEDVSHYPEQREVLFSANTRFVTTGKSMTELDGMKTFTIELRETTGPTAKNFFDTAETQLRNPAEKAAWRRARQYVENNFHRIGIDGESLLRIHSEVAEGVPFENAALRRKAAGMWEDEPLHGRFRASPIDDYVTNGDHLDESGNRYFLPDELEGYMLNPFFMPTELQKMQSTASKAHATIRFVHPRHVERVTERILQEAGKSILHARTNEDKLILIFKLYKALMSTHPFVDGNGRAIRLYITALLKKFGFPTGYFPHIPEYETPISVMLREYIAGNSLHRN